MPVLRRQSLVEQTASHLREGFRLGRWSGQLRGVLSISRELGVSKDTVRDALQHLEHEGLIKNCGAGKNREILVERSGENTRKFLRVGVLLSEPLAGDNAGAQHLLLSIRSEIEMMGHVCFFAEEALSQQPTKSLRLARLIKAAKADAWIISSGTREVLEWFIAQKIACFAIGGRSRGLAISGSSTDISHVVAEVVQMLTTHGHRRIVMICPSVWRTPNLGPSATSYLAALEACGISTTDFNLPQWNDCPAGLDRLLGSLFQVTPPTALLFSEPTYCFAALSFLSQRGLHVPRDVSIVNLIPDPVFAWRQPALAQLQISMKEHFHCVTRWVNAVANGTHDIEQIHILPSFERGGTIAAAKK